MKDLCKWTKSLAIEGGVDTIIAGGEIVEIVNVDYHGWFEMLESNITKTMFS